MQTRIAVRFDRNTHDEPKWITRLGIPIDNIRQHFQKFELDWRLFYDSQWIEKVNTEYESWVAGENKSCPYIKLHGSRDLYVDSTQNVMIIGREKEAKIKGFEILRSYYDIFKKTLSNNKCKILIIGYGFGDGHINCALRNSVNGKNSELYIVTKQNVEDLLQVLKTHQISTNQLQGIYTDGLTKNNINLLIKNYCNT